MKIKQTHILFLFAILVSTNIYGQNSVFNWGDLKENSNRLQGKMRGEGYYITALASSEHFLHKDWYDASIVLEDNDVFENIKVRYLAYGDELISYNERLRSAFFKVDKEIVKEFMLNEKLSGGGIIKHKFVKIYYDGPLKNDYRYFEELYSGKRKLLAFHKIEKEHVSPYSDKMGVLRDDRYRLKASYYLYSDDFGFTKVTFRRRSFLKALPEHKKQIRKIFRQNKFYILNQSSIIQAISLMDAAGLLN